MKERNLCAASGCPGYCCQNIDLEMTKLERKRIFPNAIRVDTMEELAEKKNQKEPGVFYTRYRRKHLGDSGFVVTAINGACPNKEEDGNCIKHEERSHAARNFKIGCHDCNEIRKEHGLGPLFFEPVE